RFGTQRAKDAQLIGDLAQSREDRADFLTGLPVPLERVLWRKTLQLGALKLGNRLSLGERFWHRLAVHGRQLGLVVPSLQVRWTARHVQPDHALDARGEVHRVYRARPARGQCLAWGPRVRLPVPGEHPGQRQGTETRGRSAQKGAPRLQHSYAIEVMHRL